MMNSVNRPDLSAQGTETEAHPLFPEYDTGPFQNNATEQKDLRFIRRFGPGGAPIDMTGYGKGQLEVKAPSALSSPDNFIADGFLKRAERHHRWAKHWRPALGVGVLLGVAAATLFLGGRMLEGTGFISRLAEVMPRSAGQSAKPSQPSTPVEATSSISAITPPELPARATQSAVNLEQRLKISGLRDEMQSKTVEAPIKITAFPPALPLPSRDGAPALVEQVAPNLKEAEPPVATNSPAGVSAPFRLAPDPRQLDVLIGRGEQLLASGEVAAARLFFERAASEGDPRGARGMARSYDEAVLKRVSTVGLRGNGAETERWYLRAAELEARQTRDHQEARRPASDVAAGK